MGNWDDIIIGKGEKRTTAILVFAIKGKHSISENGISYWISDAYLDIGMTIYKNTDEGKKLTALIEEEAGLDKINDFLAKVVLANVTPAKLKRRIEESNKEHFEKGKKAKASELRQVLEIHT